MDHELTMQFSFGFVYVAVQLTFISSRFGGRDGGFVPPEGAELWRLWLPWIDRATEGAATGRGAEQVVTELEEEEEDGCWSVRGLLDRVKGRERIVISTVFRQFNAC